MANEKSDRINVLTFDFGSGRGSLVSPVIDGKNFLSEWDLGGIFSPLKARELVEPILAMEDIRFCCESIALECFALGSCTCGYTGCGAVYCDITLEYGEMVWKNFRTSASSNLSEIGPFKFDWDQVVEDLRRARDAHGNTLS